MAAAAAMISRKHRSLGYRNSYRRSAYDEDADGPNMCWLTIFGICGVTLIGTGAWYAYDSFEDPRIVAIRPYNAAVDAWNNQHRAEFASSSFEWRLVSPQAETVTVKGNCEDEAGTKPEGCIKTHQEVQYKDVDKTAASTAAWTPMTQAMINEPLAHDQSKVGINDYEPLRWVGTGVLPAHPPGHLETNGEGATIWTGSQYKLQLRTTKDGKQTIFDVEPIAPMKEVSVPANLKMCRLHHGNNFHDHRCWDRVAVSSVCLRLNYTSDGWKAPEGLQRGCAAGSELSFSRSCPGTPIGSRGQLGMDTNCDFSNVNFTVRSIADPHIIAEQLTAGTLNFGYTPHENWVTGIIMMCIGGVLLCPIGPVLCSWLYTKRARHSAYMRSDSIFTQPRQPYSRPDTQSPSPSVGSGATDDDYRVDIQSHSRNSSQSPRRRRFGDKDFAVPNGVSNSGAELYGVQPGGLVDPSAVDVEMQRVAGEQTAPGSNDWRARARAYTK